MTKGYWRSSFSKKQWHALIDSAELIGCSMVFDKYGDHIEINIDKVVSNLIKNFGNAIGSLDGGTGWEVNIFRMLDDAAKSGEVIK